VNKRISYRAYQHEIVVTLVMVCMIGLIGSINPAFFSLANTFDLLKSMVVMGLFAIGVLIVMISGGIDISFTAIAAFGMYVTCRLLVAIQFPGSFLVAFSMAGLIGTGLGLLNAVFVSCFQLPTLIVTLGTASMFRGFLLAFVGTAIVHNLPPGLIGFSKWTLFQQRLPSGEMIGLSVSFFVFLLAAVTVWFLLRYTIRGRGIYAMGGNPVAAERAGFNLSRLRFFIYGLVGCLSGVAGITHASMMRNANPFDLVGTELTVIAAVVLGGASITGGRGTVIGTVLGVLLMVIINNSLILLEIPSYWQRVAVGLIIIASTGIPAWKNKTRRYGDTTSS
jgi:simple sugar transport system permease protein